MEGTRCILLAGLTLLFAHQTLAVLHKKTQAADVTVTCPVGGGPISIQSAYCTTGVAQVAFVATIIHAKVIQDIAKKCNGLQTCTVKTADLGTTWVCPADLQIDVGCSTSMKGFVGSNFNGYLACAAGFIMNSLTFTCTGGGFPAAANLNTLKATCETPKVQDCMQSVTDIATQTIWCSAVANSIISHFGYTCNPLTEVKLDVTVTTATAMTCPVVTDAVYPFAVFCETDKSPNAPPTTSWPLIRQACSGSNTCSKSQDDFNTNLCTVKTATFAHIHCMKKVDVATAISVTCPPGTTDKVFLKYLLCKTGTNAAVEESLKLDPAREKCNGMPAPCALASTDVLVAGISNQCTATTGLLEYSCGTSDVVMAPLATAALKLTCGQQLMINVKKVSCFPSKTVMAATVLANANKLCHGRTGTCDLKGPVSPLVALTDPCPTNPNGPDTMVEYECLETLQVDIVVDKVKVVCPTDMFIQFGDTPVTCTVTPDRHAIVKDTCTGKKGTCEVTTGACPGLTVTYKCVKEISAYGLTTVALMCSADAMIKPTKVQCSKSDGSGALAADTVRLPKAEGVCQGAQKSSVTVADLGTANPVCGTLTNTLITYSCVTVLTAAHTTDIKLQCGKDLMIMPTDVRCSAANGANPGPAPDTARLDKLKALVVGANSYNVKVTDLGAKVPDCTGTTTHTMISYKCVKKKKVPTATLR